MSTVTNAVSLITVLTASSSVHFEKLCCSLRAFALVFSIVFYNRIMATCSPSQERQLVLVYEQEIGFIFREPEETGRKKHNASARNVNLRTEFELKTGETK